VNLKKKHELHWKTGGGWSGKCVLVLKFLVVALRNSCLNQSVIDWWMKVKNYHSIFLCQYSGFDWVIYLALLLISVCCAIVEAVRQCLVTIEAKVCSQASPSGISDRQSSSRTCFPPIILDFYCHCSVNAPYSYFFHLQSTLHNISSWQYRWTMPFSLSVVSLMVVSVYMFVDSLVTFTYLCLTHSKKLGKLLTYWAHDVLEQHPVFPIKELKFLWYGINIGDWAVLLLTPFSPTPLPLPKYSAMHGFWLVELWDGRLGESP